MAEKNDSATAQPALQLAVVVPAHQAEDEIVACLAAIRAAGFPAATITVVDDGSRDATGTRAAAAGARVLRNDTAQRPARARNRGVAGTSGDVIVFVDADVVIHPGARDRILNHFKADPGLTALFGSYDAAPVAPRPVSRYRNLLHHFVHQTGRPEADTFWTGLGAVRRQAFDAAGGFDPAWENIEDVEFGLRLRAAGGRILLDRDLLCTHLKDWTLAAMIRTDWKGRAVPWTRLLKSGRAVTGDLNLALAHRISAGLVALTGLGLVTAFMVPPALWVAAGATAAFVAVNGRFLAFLVRTEGPWFALRAVVWHMVHYGAALAGYAEVTLRRR